MESAAENRRVFQEDAKRRRARDTDNLFAIAPEKQHVRSPRPSLQSVSQVLVGLEQRIRDLRAAKNLAAGACAEEVLAIIRELIRFEGVSGSLDFELPHFFQALWAEAPIRALVESIVRVARAILNPNCNKPLLDAYHPAQQIALVDYLIDWYAQRRATLALFDGQHVFGAGAVVVRSVTHDQFFLGERGFEIVSSVRVDGFEFQSLWLSATLFSESAPVRVRKGWEYWARDSELFVVARDQSFDSRDQYVASVMPIVPRDQRAIYHALRLFVPYSALDLPASARQQIDCEVSLLSASGAVLSADACTETLTLPGESERARPAIPSLPALGFWPRNVGNGDTVTVTGVEQQRRIEARREIHSLVLSSDMLFVNRVGQTLTLEVRFLTREGNVIESEYPSYSGRDGSFLYRSAITVSTIIARYPELSCEIPMVALDLDPGNHELIAELIVLDAQNEVICGAVSVVGLMVVEPHPGQLIEMRESCAEAPDKIDSTLFVEGVSIDASYVFNSRDAVRAEIVFTDRAQRTELMQLRAVLSVAESGAGDAFERAVARGMSFVRRSNQHEHRMVFIFDCDEVLRMASGIVNKRLLKLDVEVLDTQGQLNVSTRRTFTVPAQFGVERGVPSQSLYGKNDVEIIDAQIRETPQRGGELLIELTTNFDLLSMEREGYSLYVEPLNRPRDAKALERISPDGFLVEIKPPTIEQSLVAQWALVQQHSVVRMPQALRASGARGLKMMLFSPSGRLLQVVYQRLKAARSGERLLPAEMV